MKRLIIAGENQRMPEPLETSEEVINEHPDGTMVELDFLSEADVRHDRCPICENENAELIKRDGFKTCNSCGSQFKILNGRAYVIV